MRHLDTYAAVLLPPVSLYGLDDPSLLSRLTRMVEPLLLLPFGGSEEREA